MMRMTDSLLPIAVAHDKNSKRCAQTKQNEAIIFFGMLRIGNNPGAFVEEGTARLLK